MSLKRKPQAAARATELIGALSAEQAYSVGAAVGSLLKGGMPTREAINSTAMIAEFVKRGVAAERAVDEIIAAERLKHNS